MPLHDLLQFLQGLSHAEREFLRKQLLAPSLKEVRPVLSAAELCQVETWLWDRIAQSSTWVTRQARLRSYYIFIMLRYAGLRLREIVALTRANLDLFNACVKVTKGVSRTIYLPNNIARRLTLLSESTPFAYTSDHPFNVQSSTLRHIFRRCARACNLPQGSLNARNIRRARAFELQHLGLDSEALSYFLGLKTIASKNVKDRELEQICQEYCQMETSLRTSARNVFQGRVEELEASGLMVRVTLKTASGLRLKSLITDRSCKRLQIAPGCLVQASIKAPFIDIIPQAYAPTSQSVENSFRGIVSEVRGDTVLLEVTATLPEGSQVCALQGSQEWLPQIGEQVLVLIKALAIVLSTDLG
ncbi:MAG: TOBE domain-containing protein [Desulfovibrionaceae bacterium]|nr:TOBE domain-containing protein [Desulfovibrionaceae bacterium]